MIQVIEKAVVLGRSWGEKNVCLVENQLTGEVVKFNFSGQDVLELGAEGVIEYHAGTENTIISFVSTMEEVLA